MAPPFDGIHQDELPRSVTEEESEATKSERDMSFLI
jgi:hypothetical protein